MMKSKNSMRGMMVAMALMEGIGAYQSPAVRLPRTVEQGYIPASARPTLTRQKATHLRTGVAKARRAAAKRRNIAKHS